MNKADLISVISEKTKLSRKDTEKVLTAFTNTVTDALAEGIKVSITGFGSFQAAERAARKGRNPKTGETVFIPKVKSPTFKAGKALKDAVKT